MSTKWSLHVLVLLAVPAIVSCSSKPADLPTNAAPIVQSEADTSPSAMGSEEPTSAATITEEVVEQAPAPAPATADEPVAAADADEVTLGTAELTAGIPGEGPLETTQINAWLAIPENHMPLKIKLPLGLAAGATNIKIPADNPITRAKVELGRQLYFDRRLSADGTVSCADCHRPDEGFARHTQFGVGINGQTGNRNSPVSYNRILSGAQFWDGRADSLEAQAIGPIVNPIEMGNTHDDAVKTIENIAGYRVQFEKIFGDGVSIDNIGKAIATFERTVVTGPAPFDYHEPLRAFKIAFKEDLEDLDALKEEDPELVEQYQELVAASEANPISESASRGRELFFSQRINCTACHVGANLTDEKYHNLGVGMTGNDPDLGRSVVSQTDKDRGAFKTPTIRNVELTAPYMHDGSLKTLDAVVDWYDKGGHPNPQLSKDVKKLKLTDQEKQDLVAFMKACTGEFPKVETGRLP